MVYLFIAAWFWTNEPRSLNLISRNNQARREAEAAYQAGRYHQALTRYVYLSRTTTPIDPAVRLNLGHTYFQLKRYNRARAEYELLLQSDRPDLRTVAATQLGVMACVNGDSIAALMLFRQALIENADNEPARYNFELIKKNYSAKLPAKNSRRKLSDRKPQLANKPRPAGGQQVERSDRQDELLRRFQRLNLSEAQALQLLDAMQSDDLPYALTRSARRLQTTPIAGMNRW